MAEQIRKNKPARRERVDEQPMPKVAPQDDEALAAMDALLDEIEGVLEENAEEMVKGYVQQGGQ